MRELLILEDLKMKKILSMLFSKNNVQKLENTVKQTGKKAQSSVFLDDVRGEFGNFSSIFW